MTWNKIVKLKNEIMAENENIEENEILESENTLLQFIYNRFIDMFRYPIADYQKKHNEEYIKQLSSDIINDITYEGALKHKNKISILDAYRIEDDPTYIYIVCKFNGGFVMHFPIDAGYNFIC